MDVLSISSTFNKSITFSILKPPGTLLQHFPINLRLPNSFNKTSHFNLPPSSSSFSFCSRISATSTTTDTWFASSSTENRHWIVIMEKPPQGVNSKPQVIDYYVQTLQRVLGSSEKEAQMCIYDASWDTQFGFCCDIDEEASSQLARIPGVVSVKSDPDFNSAEKDYSYRSSNVQEDNFSKLQTGVNLLFPSGNSKHWLVRMDKPGVGIVTKAQVVDYYAQILTKVIGNEKDAQMCIYHVSWKTNFGFCCELDEDCARELAGVPGVLSVQPDNNFESENKDYGGSNLENSMNVLNSSGASQATPVKTKKLFVTGLSFYTSEKTLRAAFEGFGELVEVKVIMDKISKRSKGYAFVEYTTEEAAAAALKEMNGKIINGWMIVVDVAKTIPSKYNRGRARSAA
ncbi:organelle RRM domain-containing protein 1, chloroplastic [Senna tora]|uniref:Organelle RRM domain-containing protein 1, chloroplastic n=1 Tax=Senna tora TaxID=362788 RepID=A0A834TFT2_9FABA|nr:organelle RRM domain-containing protein 1, chloroplastic [Senna tora]